MIDFGKQPLEQQLQEIKQQLQDRVEPGDFLSTVEPPVPEPLPLTRWEHFKALFKRN